jgi:phosphoribosylamine--glycine ligase
VFGSDQPTIVVGEIGRVASDTLLLSIKYKEVYVLVESGDIATAQKAIEANSAYWPSISERRSLATKAFKLAAAQSSATATRIAMEMNVLVVGGGGREHALSWKLAQSSRVGHVFVAPGNGGTAQSEGMSNVALGEKQHDELIAFALANDVGLVVVGPEAPLIDGLADKVTAAGVPCFGPSALAAQLEGSKAFSKNFMAKHGVRTARFQNFTDFAAASQHLKEVDYPVVIKASGIAAGKGVVLPETTVEALQELQEMMVNSRFGDAGNEVVIEERLEGEEVSLLAFVDGESVALMPGAQDHKRAYDGDRGPNTGGMGAYAPAPALTPAIREEARVMVQKIVDAMAAEGMAYRGVLYTGLMLTATGPAVLEFNCRFGDPETQVLMPLLESDLAEVPCPPPPHLHSTPTLHFLLVLHATSPCTPPPTTPSSNHSLLQPLPPPTTPSSNHSFHLTPTTPISRSCSPAVPLPRAVRALALSRIHWSSFKQEVLRRRS